MARRALNNPRQKRSKSCGCVRCLEQYPEPERKRRRDCVGSWQARYRDANGEQKSKNFRTKKEADAFLDAVRSEVRKGTYLDPKRGDITVGEWWALWWPTQPQRRTTTVSRKMTSWNAHIAPKWAKRRLNSLGFAELQSWMTHEVKGYATQTKVLELLRMMLRDAVRDQRLTYNPAADVVKTAKPTAKHPDDLKPPTLEQYERIRAALPEYYRPLADFAQETGMRWGEIAGLRRSCVDLDECTVKVKEVVIDAKAGGSGRLRRQAAPKTGAGFRTVPLSPKAVAALRVMIELWDPAGTESPIEDGMHPEELVFRLPSAGSSRKSGGVEVTVDGVLSRNNFRRYWIPAIKEAGVARVVVNPESGRKEWWPRVHDYRHALASRLHAAGLPEKDVQLVLGQERGGRVTWLYTHGSEGAMEAARAAITGGRVLRVVQESA